MKNTVLYQLRVLFFAILVISGLSSCKKEQTPDQPQLPPIESMIMDFSDFAQNPSTTKGITTDYNNFINAYGNEEIKAWKLENSEDETIICFVLKRE